MGRRQLLGCIATIGVSAIILLRWGTVQDASVPLSTASAGAAYLANTGQEAQATAIADEDVPRADSRTGQEPLAAASANAAYLTEAQSQREQFPAIEHTDPTTQEASIEGGGYSDSKDLATEKTPHSSPPSKQQVVLKGLDVIHFAASTCTGEVASVNSTHRMVSTEGQVVLEVPTMSASIPQPGRDFPYLCFPRDSLQYPFVRFGNPEPAENVRAGMKERKRLRVVVFGGSITVGRHCIEGKGHTEKSCAWSARLHRWLSARFPGVTVEVHNFGSGGLKTAAGLPMVAMRMQSLAPVDIVIWDFSVNDCISGFCSPALVKIRDKKRKGPIPPAIVEDALERERQEDSTWVAKKRELEQEVAASAEAFVRLVLQISPQAMIIWLFLGPPRAWSPELGWAIHDCQKAFLPMLAHYRIPLVSYFDLADMDANTTRRSGRQGELWTLRIGQAPGYYYLAKLQDHRHPAWQTHAFIAYVLASFLQTSGAIEEGLANRHAADAHKSLSPQPLPLPLASQKSLDQWPVCLKPLSTHIADEVFRSAAPSNVKAKGWDFMEDVPGKPGWISTKGNAVLEFPVMFGSHPALALTYLSSYEGVGAAHVSLEKGEGEYLVDAHWEDRTSQATTIFFKPALAHMVEVKGATEAEAFQGDGLGGFNIRPNSRHMLRIRSRDKLKFKILSVISC